MTTHLSIEMDLPDEPYEQYQEIVYALDRVKDKVLHDNTSGRILDINGNTVGQWSLNNKEQ